MYESTRLKAKLIQDLTMKHYEQGRQDRCKLWVFRHIVSKSYPMSERTFFRYLRVDTTSLQKQDEDKRQLKIQFD